MLAIIGALTGKPTILKPPEYHTYTHLGADILSGFPPDVFDPLRQKNFHCFTIS